MKKIIAVFLSAVIAVAQTGTIDYVMSVKNKPELDPRNYVFTRTNGAGASSASMTSGSGKTATLTPCPAGITSASVNHSYVRITGGTGTAEATQITNFSSSGSNCTITFNLANSHTGSWVIRNNANGLQEALIDGAALGRAVHAVAGGYAFYAPVYVPAYATIRGDGSFVTWFQAQAADMVILDAPGDHNTFLDFGMSNLGNVQGTSGNVGIRLGTAIASNSFTSISRLFFDFLYDDVLSVNAHQLKISDCTFYDPSHAGITLANPLAPDNAGAQVVNNMFFSYVTLGTPAEAFVLITSTSSDQFTNNNFIGSGANIDYCLKNTSTTSGGWMNVTGNKCENTRLGGFHVNGTWTQLSMAGNVLSNSGGLNNWTGVQLSGSGIQYRNVIGPNVIQCGGTGNNGIYLSGTYQTTSIVGNEIMGCNFGINANGSPATTYIGPNHITGSLTSNVYSAGTGVTVDMTGPFSYANLVDGSGGIWNVANGSRVFCSDCNSTCTGGSGTGRTCFKENGTWTH